MAKYSWPTDPPGKAPSHSIPWAQHQQNMGTAAANSGNKPGWIGSSFVPGSLSPVPPSLAPPVTTAPVPTPQPFDPAFESQKLGAGWNIQLADSESGYQKGETAWGTGYNADGSLNTSNPYSQAQLLQNEYKRGVTGTNNAMAANGQLYSGARLNAQGHNDRVYAEGSSALRDQARQTYHGIDYSKLSTYGQNALGTNDADYQSLRKAIYG